MLWGAVCFTAAGTIEWVRGWIYLALYVASIAATAAILLKTNPGVIIARGENHKGTKTFDKVCLALYTPLLIAVPAVAGLDAVRYRWSSIPFAAVYFGAVLHLLGNVPVVWALAVNPFLETTVRIQKDRGHTVITSGPYRFVRHPMYAGAIVTQIAIPLVLGSMWAWAPVAAIVLLFIVRTALEDRTLRDELPGYAEYAQQTRFHLLPGVW